jgi:hypothetical protein
MADISKYSVVDPRIVQQKPKYAVEKGALSITNATFQAIASSASQQTFQIQVPSENVFVDRAIDWVVTASADITVTYAGNPGAGLVLATPGTNFSLAPLPTSQCISTMMASINDQTVSINMSDVLPQVLRLADMAKTRKQRTCPTMLDKYAAVTTTTVAPNSPVSSYGSAYDSADVGNGAWRDLTFAAGTNTTLTAAGLPQTAAGQSVFTFRVTWTTAEKLVLPPFIFSDEDELSTGLFGVQNIQFTMNFNLPTRAFRYAPQTLGGQAVVSQAAAWASGGNLPFSRAVIQAQFLTPSLDVPLPSKSVVPYMEFPRYISNSTTLLAAADQLVNSQTITLPNIPDLLIIYMKPQSYASSAVCDFSVPVQKISISFDNFSGLLSSHSAYELYKMSVNNGLDMDWAEWSGSAWVNGAKTALVGGPLVLRPGRDFALSTGQAPGLVGNFTLQFDLTVDNSLLGYVSPVSIYTIAANSGFFETIRGSSRIVKGVVTETDILAAPVQEVPQSLERMVGEGKHKGHVGRKPGMAGYTR